MNAYLVKIALHIGTRKQGKNLALQSPIRVRRRLELRELAMVKVDDLSRSPAALD
jgi:hypothetical protein